MERLRGKIALVTGGTRGIGAGIVQAFLKEGAVVGFSGTTEDGVSRAALQFAKVGEFKGFVADLSGPRAGTDLVNAALDQLGRLDIVVNNAGVGGRLDEWENNSRRMGSYSRYQSSRDLLRLAGIGTRYAWAAWGFYPEYLVNCGPTRWHRRKSRICVFKSRGHWSDQIARATICSPQH